jgi:hypothetical protein
MRIEKSVQICHFLWFVLNGWWLSDEVSVQTRLEEVKNSGTTEV